jgi:hypothetical protein
VRREDLANKEPALPAFKVQTTLFTCQDPSFRIRVMSKSKSSPVGDDPDRPLLSFVQDMLAGVSIEQMVKKGTIYKRTNCEKCHGSKRDECPKICGGEGSKEPEAKSKGPSRLRWPGGKEAATNDGAKGEDELSSILECPVCQSTPRSGHIYQCPNGHIVCQKCLDGLHKKEECPTCRAAFKGPQRNLVAERMVEKLDLVFPCVHADRGCRVESKRSKIEAHEASCEERPIQCLDEDCKTVVSFRQLIDHMSSKHHVQANPIWTGCPSGIMDEGYGLDEDYLVNPSSPLWLVQFHPFEDHQFLPMMRKVDGHYQMLLYIVGGEEVASRYEVEISLSGSGGFHIECMAKVFSVDTRVKDAFGDVKNYLSVSSVQARRCMEEPEDPEDEDDRGCLRPEWKIVEKD